MQSNFISGRYQVIRVLAEGGFGKTFLTEDTHLPSRPYRVLKQLKPIVANPQIYQLVQDRFQREAAILEDLGNSNERIPSLYAYFSEQGQFYLVQEFIQGQTLSKKVETSGLMGETVVKEILNKLLYVLNFVHSKGIIHRDIKPDNIILRDADNIPVLIDFGAVRESMGTSINSQGNSTSSIIIGTPGFMPSEQAAGRPIWSSDLYALALTMIYLLTGKMPHEFPTDYNNGNILWRQYANNISPTFGMILDKAIAYHPNERYATAKEMINALQSNQVYAGVNAGNVPGANPTANNPQVAYNSGGNVTPPTVIPLAGNQNNYQPNQPLPNPPPIGNQNNYQHNNQPNYPGSGNQAQPYNQYYASQNMLGGGGTFNTSVPVPPEIQGWNWGAFLLSPFWSFPNQVWIGLISLIPFVGLAMGIVLGAKGNTWAWRSRQWKSIQAFKDHQRAWTIAGLCLAPFVFTFSSGFYSAFLSGSNTSDTNTSNPTPSRPVQTTQTPTTSTTTPEPTTSPSPITTNSVNPRVEIGDLETYTHSSGVFSIDIPSGWKVRENSKSGLVSVQWQDKDENGFIQVDMFAREEKLTQTRLRDILSQTVKKVFGSLSSFSADEPVSTGNFVRVSWSYVQTQNNSSIPVVGNSFISQQGNKVFMITDAIPRNEFDRLKAKLNQILNSYKVDASVSLP
ncbi:MAG: serine/threonine protein kinase [Scytonematopsis contorta HA4267-MV1]|jgi:serine/threonine-protein kinase|nr:serine/threonine protein kinase [Scytonematopsis contorta HA4267-MV1]